MATKEAGLQPQGNRELCRRPNAANRQTRRSPCELTKFFSRAGELMDRTWKIGSRRNESCGERTSFIWQRIAPHQE
jgi:hypothetical protein